MPAYAGMSGGKSTALIVEASYLIFPPMRRWLRPLWVILAPVFLLEAWLWDHLEPIVARVVNLVPWGRVKVWLKGTIEGLPPWAALGVFIIPLIVLLPLKFLEVFF